MNNLCGKLKCAEYAPPVMLIAETGKGRFLMESRTYYYARVSSREQNLDRQFAAFAALGAQERDIIADKESGKSINRSGYTALKSALLRRGDTLVIKSLDRLSRNKEDTKRELQYFRENGIRLKVLDLPTTMIEYPVGQEWVLDMVNNILVEVLASIAQQERETIHQRQAEGIAAAKQLRKAFRTTKYRVPCKLEYSIPAVAKGADYSSRGHASDGSEEKHIL